MVQFGIRRTENTGQRPWFDPAEGERPAKPAVRFDVRSNHWAKPVQQLEQETGFIKRSLWVLQSLVCHDVCTVLVLRIVSFSFISISSQMFAAVAKKPQIKFNVTYKQMLLGSLVSLQSWRVESKVQKRSWSEWKKTKQTVERVCGDQWNLWLLTSCPSTPEFGNKMSGEEEEPVH